MWRSSRCAHRRRRGAGGRRFVEVRLDVVRRRRRRRAEHVLSTHWPRLTGDVRFGADVTVRMLPWPSSPRRSSPRARCGGSGCRECSACRSAGRAARRRTCSRRTSRSTTLRVLAQHAREQELGLLAEGLPQVAVEVAARRAHGVELAQAEPLRREVRDERVGLRIGEHAPHLALEHGRFAQLAGRGAPRATRSSGMLLHRKNDSRDASSTSLTR